MTTFTNSKLTDEYVSNATLIRLILWADQHNSHYVVAALRELQERRKADSVPVEINDDMAYAFHHALSDSSLGSDEIEEIKTGLRAAFANVTVQPVLIVPDEMDLLTCHLDGVTETYADGWNACRVAMLQAGNFRENKDSSTNNFREISETSTSSPGVPAGWISCSDAVPAEYCDVILCDDLGNVFPGSWDKVFCLTRGGNKMAFVDKDGVEVESSTHWMPLPEPPQEVNQ
ncbi:DUF551 domain-containing protein [Escherichia coli]|uniref:DUF551 domain-containing protein n=1 Tax=Escherichia coli TaxID=562 RepID=UPI0002495D33|nr:DUF551 domain-containing protein [Escherichia coli]EHP66427.1 hypothetical protein HMPREF0986_01559 [Escherichia coli 4_1_47FAA]